LSNLRRVKNNANADGFNVGFPIVIRDSVISSMTKPLLVGQETKIGASCSRSKIFSIVTLTRPPGGIIPNAGLRQVFDDVAVARGVFVISVLLVGFFDYLISAGANTTLTLVG
jgi:hypothetical protein